MHRRMHAFVRTMAAAGLLVTSGVVAVAASAESATAATTGQPIAIDYTGTTPTPAPPVPGARTGGQLTWLQAGSPEHFDPQQIYDALGLSTQLFYRTLTGYLEDPAGGQLKLVGDLATDAGEPNSDDTVWTYHLRDGITFEDGTPITSRDIAYGIARSFSDYGVYGPQYIQYALDPDRTYQGPYSGQTLPPGVATPDDKTLVFTFAQPHPEFPYLAALPTTTPVPEAKDTQAGYEDTWVASGPYRRAEAVPGDHLLLERNPNWQPASDPIRHQYPDSILLDWTVDRDTQTARLLAAAGGDAAAVMTENVAPNQIATVKSDPQLLARTLSGPTPTAEYININTARVTDVSVRRALNYAFDRGALVSAMGGADVAQGSTTILAPTVPGYQEYDAYPQDVSKARDLLAGRTPQLTYCFQDTSSETGYAQVVKNSLERAGFRINLNPLDVDSYYTTVGTRGTGCDLITSGWVGDYPDGDTTLRVTLDGNLIGDAGNVNFSYLNEPWLNDKLEQLAALTDRADAAGDYGELDQTIMERYAPLIPTVYVRVFSLRGPKVGGVFLSSLYGLPNLANAYVIA